VRSDGRRNTCRGFRVVASGSAALSTCHYLVELAPTENGCRLYFWRRDRTVDTSRKFTAFLEQKFPVGTDEANVRSSLIEAGFKPVSGVGRSECEKPVEIEPIGWAFVTCKVPFNFFEYIWSGGIVCGHSLIVQWSKEDSGGIVRIVGNYSTHCL
jgi:hypothetical protein